MRQKDDLMKCAQCSKCFHLGCANVEVEDFLKLRDAEKLDSWKCGGCVVITSEDKVINDVATADFQPGVLQNDNQQVVHCTNCMCVCSRFPDIRVEFERLTRLIEFQSNQIIMLRENFDKQISELKSAVNSKCASVPVNIDDVPSGAEKPVGSNMSYKNVTKNISKVDYVSSVLTKDANKARQGSLKTASLINVESTHAPGHASEILSTADYRVNGKNVNINIDSNTEENVDARFTVVKNRRRRRPDVTVGTCAGDDGFSGVAKRAWLYVGRVQGGTSAECVTKHPKTKCPDTNFEVETLRSDGKSCSFKVSFDFEKLNTVTNPEVWPRNVVIRKFEFNSFFRGRPDSIKGRQGESAHSVSESVSS